MYDVTFENVQAGERTSHLFRLANQHNALVLGTGDLSELALGWMTYGVGDHMSHYNVNCSVSKTLIQHLIRWVVSSGQFDAATNATLEAILATEISPELVPHADGDSAKPAQKTADKVGPYELQDFNLYFITRHGFRPSKVAFLAWHAWGDKNRGAWPDLLPAEKRNEYDLRADQEVARGVPLPLLQDQPVQALGHPQRPEGRLRRLALAARRLARAQRLRGRGVAEGTAGECAGLTAAPAHVHRVTRPCRGLHQRSWSLRRDSNANRVLKLASGVQIAARGGPRPDASPDASPGTSAGR